MKTEDEAIDEILEELGTAYHNNYPDKKAHKQAKQALLAYIESKVVKAQTNGVAWAISIIDQLHMRDIDSLDRTYKGIKNKLRDDYKFEVGIDPAPKYPIKAALKAQEGKDA